MKYNTIIIKTKVKQEKKITKKGEKEIKEKQKQKKLKVKLKINAIQYKYN